VLHELKSGKRLAKRRSLWEIPHMKTVAGSILETDGRGRVVLPAPRAPRYWCQVVGDKLVLTPVKPPKASAIIQLLKSIPHISDEEWAAGQSEEREREIAACAANAPTTKDFANE
jgi:hypothetical protein